MITELSDRTNRVLRILVDLMTGHIPIIDMISWIGGEELVLALPGTKAAGASLVAQRLLKRVARDRFDIGNGGSIPVSISSDITLSNDGQDNIYTFLARADVALYSAKHQGCNEIAFDSWTPIDYSIR